MQSIFVCYPTHPSTRVYGNVARCRSLDTVGNVKDNTLEEIWNGPNMQKLREQFINNERPKGVDCAGT